MTAYDDYIGFSIDGIHSSELGIVRVSSSNRYNNIALPTFQDKTVQVGGRDGTYLFGSNYQKREFTIPFAFDNLNEAQVRKIQALCSDLKPHKLVFDEWPFKYYNVKLSSPPEFKYLVFDEYIQRGAIDNKDYRVYKGEGTYKFVCYEPFGRSTIEFQSETIDDGISSVYYSGEPKEKGTTVKYLIASGSGDLALYYSSDWIYDRAYKYISTRPNFLVDGTRVLYQKEEQPEDISPYLNFIVLEAKYKEGDLQIDFINTWGHSLDKTEYEFNQMISKDLNFRIISDEDGKLYLEIQVDKKFRGKIEGRTIVTDEEGNKNIGDTQFVIDLNIAKDNPEIEDVVYDGKWGNKKEWLQIANMAMLPEKEEQGKIYNYGDFDMPFRLYIPYEGIYAITGRAIVGKAIVGLAGSSFTIKMDDKILKIKNAVLKEDETGFVYDGELNLIRGYQEIDNKKILTDSIYNRYIIEGDFFNVPAGGEREITVDFETEQEKELAGLIAFEYEYRYI